MSEKIVKCMIPIQVEVRLNLCNVNCHLSQKMEKMAPPSYNSKLRLCRPLVSFDSCLRIMCEPNVSRGKNKLMINYDRILSVRR